MMNFEQEAPASTPSFTDIRPQWKKLATERKITKEDIAALCLYRSLIKGGIKEDTLARLRKSFKPITNVTKLENGAYPWGSLQEALRMLKYSNVATWLTKDELALLQSLGQSVLKDIK